MVEWLVAKLGYMARFRSIFSTLPRLVAEADPAVQRQIIARAEESVYGGSGLQAYESGRHSELQQCARRSLAQHLCQRALRGGLGAGGVRSLACAFALPFLLAIFLISSLRQVRASTVLPDVVVFFWYERLYKFVGQELFPGQTCVLHRGRGVRLGGREIGFALRTLRACPRLLAYPELLCNFVRWLGYYGYVAGHYRPRRAVAHFFECTASSSLITAYLHEQSLRHIDLQHGEILFVARSAFCRFDEVRLWGEHFREIFLANRGWGEAVRVVGMNYHRELFTGLRGQHQPRPRRLLVIDPFLYDGLHPYASHIRRILQQLDGAWEVRVRRHPAERRARLAWLEEMQSDCGLPEKRIVCQEEPPSVPIEDALQRSRIVVGVASSALIEAWIAGCKVIHVAGGPNHAALMARYQGSSNVFYCDDTSDPEALHVFLERPAVLDESENRRVHFLVAVTGAAP